MPLTGGQAYTAEEVQAAIDEAVAAGGGGGVAQSYVGRNAIGASFETSANGTMFMKQIVLTEDAIILGISVYMGNIAASDTVEGFHVAVFSDDGSDDIDRILAFNGVGQNVVIFEDAINSPTFGWREVPIGYFAVAGTYWIGIVTEDAQMSIAYDTGGSDLKSTGAGSSESAWFADGGRYTRSDSTRNYSIRASIVTSVASVAHLRDPYLDTLTLHGTHGDDFEAADLDAIWTPTAGFKANTAMYAVGGTWMQCASMGSAMLIYQSCPSTDTFEVIASMSGQLAASTMFGVSIVSSSGTGLMAALRAETSHFLMNTVASYIYNSDAGGQSIGGNTQVVEYGRMGKFWVSLRKFNTEISGDVYFARFSQDGFSWGRTNRVVPSTFTAAKMGWGIFYGSSTDDRFGIDRYNVINDLNCGSNLVRTPTSGTATYTASSSYSGSYIADYAADGNLGNTWSASNGATDYAGSGLYWQVAWSVGQSLNRVAFMERSGDAFGIAHLELVNGAGTHIVPVEDYVGGGGLWHLCEFPTLTGVTSLRIVADSTPGANPGFNEVEAYLAS